MPERKTYSVRSEILDVYSRNLEHLMFKRGWTPQQLSTRIGCSLNTVNRIRYGQARYIDPEVLEGCLRVFKCAPNDLLNAHPDIDYSSD